MRDMAKNIIGASDFIETFIDTPLEICEARDVKGLYKKARAGQIMDFTGIHAPYEAPLNPEIHIKTENATIAESLEILIQKVHPYTRWQGE